MPKRIGTPPPGDDEPRYIAVCHPYPANANFERAEHQQVFSQWIALYIRPEHLFAIFHKPTSPDIAIIEVYRHSELAKNLIGGYRWKDLFKELPDEMMEHESKFFWCKYHTGREVQKNGWKRIDVKDKWFQDKSYTTLCRKLHLPLIAPYHCHPPWGSNPIAAEVCHPMPSPDPERIPAPAEERVGTAEWIARKNELAAAGAPSSGSSKGKKTKAWPTVQQSVPAIPSATSNLGSRGGSTAPPPATSWSTVAAAGVPSRAAGGVTASALAQRVNVPAFGVPHPHASNLVAAKSPAPQMTFAQRVAAAGNVKKTPSETSSGSAPGAGAGAGSTPVSSIYANAAQGRSGSSSLSHESSPISAGPQSSTTSLEDTLGELNLGPSVTSQGVEGKGKGRADGERPAHIGEIYAVEGEEEDDSADSFELKITNVKVVSNPVPNDDYEVKVEKYDWGAEDDEDDGKPICPSHGKVCKPGICREMGPLMKRWEREQARKAERETNGRSNPYDNEMGSDAEDDFKPVAKKNPRAPVGGSNNNSGGRSWGKRGGAKLNRYK